MAADPNKRSRRVPLSSEEVATVIAFKRRKEKLKLIRLKQSLTYKLLNIFNTICFFIFCELIFCYLGPCNFKTYDTESVAALLGQEFKGDGTPIVAEIDMKSTEGKTYKFVVNDYVKVPVRSSTFEVGSDYLLRKDIKGSFEGSERTYRIFAASPILFLSIFTSIIMLAAMAYNLNENEYSLIGLSIISLMTLLCVMFI